jgi:hypothetical protein
MPFWISDAMIKLCRGPQWFSLSRLWFSLSRSCGIAYDWAMALLVYSTAMMLIVLGLVMLAILLAVFIG